MKKFIYLDQDYINSYLAQMKKGLLVNCSNEKQSSESTSQTKDLNLNGVISRELGVEILKILGLNLNGQVERNNSSTISDENIKSRIEEKVLHDYSFEMVEKFLKDKNLIKINDFNTGDIILEENEITIIDFEYFKNVFGNDGIFKNFRNLNKINKNTNLTLNNRENDIKFSYEIIEIIQKIIPYKRFGICGNYLILFDDKNFRDNPDIIAFKYGGKIKFMGNITNIVNVPNNQDDQDNSILNVFKNFYNIINESISQMFLNINKIYIIHAIALYY